MHSLGIVQWNSTRRDHPGNPGGVSGSGPVTASDFTTSLPNVATSLPNVVMSLPNVATRGFHL